MTGSARTPTLSVTVLNYNYGRYLSECLDSILQQSFADFEVVVIDDASSDGSDAVVAPYLRDPRVRLIRHARNQGVVKSLIEGTEVHSRGRLLTVISADDLIRTPDAFARQVAAFQSSPSVVLCFTGYERFASSNGEILQRFESFERDTVLDGLEFFGQYLQGKQVQVLHSGSMFRRSAYYACGGYRRDFRYAVDPALWLLLGLEGKVAYCGGALYGYRAHPAQMMRSYAAALPMMREVVQGIETACSRASHRGIDVTRLRRSGVKRALAATALHDAFDSRRTLAMFRWLAALMVNPWGALASRDWWIVLLRAGCGERAYALSYSRLSTSR